jgi:hypothetical protein
VSEAVEFDASALRRTSDSDYIPWRARDVTLIWIRTDGRITQAQGITDKRDALQEGADNDCLLLAWPGQYRQDIFLIDDRGAALSGLEPPTR